MSARDGVGALSYRMLDSPDQAVTAQVDDKGLLLSGSLTGISSLLITSQETFGVNQTLILAVKVSWRTAAWREFHPSECKSSALCLNDVFPVVIIWPEYVRYVFLVLFFKSFFFY